MSFFAPERLWLLLAVAALAVIYVVLQRRRSRYAVRFTNISLLDKVAPDRPAWRRHLPALAFLAMLALLVTAFARPAANAKVPRERATIMVVLDVSGSMEATDVQPTRIEAAQQAALQFVDRLPQRFNVGLVVFDRDVSVLARPSDDRQTVRAGIQNLTLGPGTAIGEGIFAALDAIVGFDQQASTNPPPARIVLLSDGASNAGRTPDDAAQAAAAAKVPVSTIAYGTSEGTVNNGRLRVPVDGPTLQRVAETTGGQFYEAATGEELQQVYQDIGSSIGFRTERREVSAWFVGLGLLAALGAAAGSLAWFSRLP
jgi:Ca-activated chloride channel homolog